MSHIYKEWDDLVREYTKKQAFIEAHERYIDIFTHMNDRLIEERKRRNKEYALNQSCNSVTQQETDNDK